MCFDAVGKLFLEGNQPHETVRLMACFTCTSHPGKFQHLLRSSLLTEKYLLSTYYVLGAGDAAGSLIEPLSSLVYMLYTLVGKRGPTNG